MNVLKEEQDIEIQKKGVEKMAGELEEL